MFARDNTLLNGFSAHYAVDRWETFTGTAETDCRFDHIAFNPADAGSAFGFLATRAADLLTGNGLAQILVVCEVLHEDTAPAGAIERRVGRNSGLHLAVTINENSPLSLSAASIAAQRLPSGTLLVADPSEGELYLRDLADRGVAEVVSAVITARTIPRRQVRRVG
jgi:hypothetical protein